MDLISGVVVVSSAFLLATAFVARPLLTTALGSGDDAETIDPRVQKRARAAMVPLLVGFFVGIADVFVTAQQPAVAFVNLIIGGAAIAILYDAARVRTKPNNSGEEWQQ